MIGLLILIIAIAGGYFVFAKMNKKDVYQANDLQYVAKTQGRDFYIYSDGTWHKKFIKGVNMGAAKPGHFPGELAITKEEYLRWFQYIGDMNADVIRVYTTLKPDFYDALYEYNQQAKKPLYLLQGVWINEDDIAKLNDAYADNGKIKNDLVKDAKDLVDIFHGNATLPAKPGFASGEYKNDVSPYVIGWILGIESDPNFVKVTDSNNPDRNNYSGRFLYTKGASPYEAFLCEAGDQVLNYEASKYHMTRPLSFTNWLTTDMIRHPNEPYEQEDMAIVNTEHIKAKANCKGGLFASYHIYPYYPEFLNYQQDYIAFKDQQGKINTYKAYLRDLFKQHTVPVLVAEFGVPASRGMTHIANYSGYNQGNHDEKEQGKINASLMQDIYDEGYCGALVFTWQDEWFKRTWNTMDLDLPDQRPFWSNAQTCEQEFGLLAFDPGPEQSICYVDGDTSDWSEEAPIYTSDRARLYAKADEKYVYMMIRTRDFDFNKDALYIPIDTISGQGNTEDKTNHLAFGRPADFLIQINNKNDSRIFVDVYYDSFYYLYAEKLNMIAKDPAYLKKDTGMFNPLYLCLSREIYLPQDKKPVPFMKYETGVLKMGDANPAHQNYNSLADFSYKDGNIEIRIPWQLLNVMDPSTKAIMGDLYKNKGIEAETIRGFYLGAGIVKSGEISDEKIAMRYFSWKGWGMPTYHERLKTSYYVLKDAFAAMD